MNYSTLTHQPETVKEPIFKHGLSVLVGTIHGAPNLKFNDLTVYNQASISKVRQ